MNIAKAKLLTLPNILTYSRIFFVFLMVFFYYLPGDWSRYAAAAVFGIAAASDWVDGHLARNYDMGSKLGELLDPVADKLLVCTALILMVDAYDNILVVFISMIIIGREITVMAMRSWLAGEVGDMLPHGVKVSLLGKSKTILQLCGIACFFVFPPDETADLYLTWLAPAVLFVASIVTLWSAYYYGHAIFKHLSA